MKRLDLSFLIILVVAIPISAQTTEFNYQGSLKDNGSPANANYDFEFAMFDALSGGNQVGSTIPKNTVLVANGVFAVKLDFGSQFPGANRYLEVRVKLSGQPTLTPLTPRQLVNSAPYSLKSLNADTAANATNATTANNATQLGGVAANQYVLTGDSRMSDTRVPSAGSANYVQNTIFQQASSNFNVSGTGTANIFTATTQFNLGGNRVLSVVGLDNVLVGVGAGTACVACSNMSAFGKFAGTSMLSAPNNSFFGARAGFGSTGPGNSFFGAFTGLSNTDGVNNTAIGNGADFSTGNLTNATAIGSAAVVSQSNSLVLGNGANVGIGTSTPSERLHVVGNGLFTGNVTVNGTLNAALPAGSTNYIQNTNLQQAASFVISGTGQANNFVSDNDYQITTRGRVLGIGGLGGNIFVGVLAGSGVNANNNSFLGFLSGHSNTNDFNTAIGSFSDGAAGITNSTALGARATVTQSNSLVLGSIASVNGAAADTNVGIGTTAPVSRLHLNNNPVVTFTNSANTAGRRGYRIAFDNDRLTFQRADDAGNFSANQVAIDQLTGNLGVGTTTPLFRFHTRTGTDQNVVVRPASDFSGGLAGIGLQSINDVNSAYKPLDLEGSQVTLNVGSSGNVGIGTPSPTAKLHVTGGNVYIANPNSLIITSPNGACWFITVGNTGTLSTISVTCP